MGWKTHKWGNSLGDIYRVLATIANVNIKRKSREITRRSLAILSRVLVACLPLTFLQFIPHIQREKKRERENGLHMILHKEPRELAKLSALFYHTTGGQKWGNPSQMSETCPRHCCPLLYQHQWLGLVQKPTKKFERNGHKIWSFNQNQ